MDKEYVIYKQTNNIIIYEGTRKNKKVYNYRALCRACKKTIGEKRRLKKQKLNFEPVTFCNDVCYTRHKEAYKNELYKTWSSSEMLSVPHKALSVPNIYINNYTYPHKDNDNDKNKQSDKQDTCNFSNKKRKRDNIVNDKEENEEWEMRKKEKIFDKDEYNFVL